MLPWHQTGLTLAARLAFAAVLAPYFMSLAASMSGGSTLSVGPDLPGTLLSYGVVYQLAPWLDPGKGPPDLSIMTSLLLHLSVLALAVLPPMLVAGLATRLAAAGMILLLAWITLIDIVAHHPPSEVLGVWFDTDPFGEIADLRLLWVMLIAIPLALGGGMVSMDALIAHWRGTSGAVRPGSRKGSQSTE